MSTTKFKSMSHFMKNLKRYLSKNQNIQMKKFKSNFKRSTSNTKNSIKMIENHSSSISMITESNYINIIRFK